MEGAIGSSMSLSPKIFIVDDDTALRLLFGRVLKLAGFETVEARDGIEALDLFQVEAPALFILDVEMPRLDGWKTLAELRRRGCVKPVLMLTHVDDVDSRVRGLDGGADDYIGKPCSATELVARVRALLRREPAQRSRPPRLRFGDLTVDLERKSAHRGPAASPARLTASEFALLECLSCTAGAPVSREEICARVWGTKAANSHALDTHLWRLRRKLGDTGESPRWVVNHPGLGYSLAPEVLKSDS